MKMHCTQTSFLQVNCVPVLFYSMTWSSYFTFVFFST